MSGDKIAQSQLCKVKANTITGPEEVQRPRVDDLEGKERAGAMVCRSLVVASWADVWPQFGEYAETA